MDPNKPGPRIALTLELTRKENDLLEAGARRDKRTREAQARWLIETYGTGFFVYTEAGAESRALLRETEEEIHYPDSVSVNTSRAGDKE